MWLDLSDVTAEHGQRYEDRYGGYLETFRKIAAHPARERITVKGAPYSWGPLLDHLNCETWSYRSVFTHCEIVRRIYHHPQLRLDRTTVEVLCGFRPELVDALWQCDNIWKPERVRQYAPQSEFIVTNNGSFFRPEVLAYNEKLRNYRPTKPKVILVPCAADKPYPAPLHKKILEFMPPDYYMACATGVLGIVPQDLWSEMPWYDSGIPNQWNLFQIACEYFCRFHHERIVVYCDFYAHVLWEVFQRTRCRWEFILGNHKFTEYVHLMSDENLMRLRAVLK